MAKLVFGILMAVVWWALHALQMDEEAALGALHEAKRAVNRAAHAAAQQVDRDRLEQGEVTLDPQAARAAAYAYLRENLRLDESLHPLPGSFLREPVTIDALAVIGAEASCPYRYEDYSLDYEVTLQHPGVVLIVHVAYPRLFGLLAPIAWDIKSCSETVPLF